jgi:transposase
MAGRASAGSLELVGQRLGPLPIVNRFIARLGLDRLLERFVPTKDPRVRLPYAKALGVLLRSLLVEREPIYRQQEMVSTFALELFGLGEKELEYLVDDHLGRALDRLFDADRGSLLTEVVVAVQRRFAVRFDELHNDSTSIRFCGQYRQARGRSVRGKRAPWITYGHSKDHRPDLKQLLWVLSSTRDGGIPVQFRCRDGNTNDTTTHIETWETLRALAGRPDFLYVGDSKLCAWENMDHLNRNQGRFLTVMPRSRQEDREFRQWIQTHEPAWELVIDRPHPRRKHGPRDRWWVFQAPLPSEEGWPVIWVRSSLLLLAQQHSRRERLAKAEEELEKLQQRLAGGRSRLRKEPELRRRADEMLRHLHVNQYLDVEIDLETAHRYRQLKAGRPGRKTRYRREARQRLRLRWTLDQTAIAYDQKTDGMYPLLTNDRSLSLRQVLEAHKGQPTLEKRFQQLKSVHELAPVLQERGADRGVLPGLLLDPAPPGPHRAGDPPGHEAPGDQATAALPGGANFRAPHEPPGAAAVQSCRAPPALPQRPTPANLRSHPLRPPATGPPLARRARQRLQVRNLNQGVQERRPRSAESK